jgi:hypothetical protein
MLGWDHYGFHKKRTGTHYSEIVFSHLVGSASHVVHSSAFGARNIDTLFFMLGWDRYDLQKKHARTHYTALGLSHPVGPAGHVVHFGASGV